MALNSSVVENSFENMTVITICSGCFLSACHCIMAFKGHKIFTCNPRSCPLRSFLQILKQREVKSLVQSHTAKWVLGWGINPTHADPLIPQLLLVKVKWKSICTVTLETFALNLRTFTEYPPRLLQGPQVRNLTPFKGWISDTKGFPPGIWVLPVCFCIHQGIAHSGYMFLKKRSSY